jgi:hypothetical protein
VGLWAIEAIRPQLERFIGEQRHRLMSPVAIWLWGCGMILLILLMCWTLWDRPGSVFPTIPVIDLTWQD